MIQIYAKYGGASCPTEESSSCVPDVCYSAESTSSSFCAKKMGMRPIRTLPVGHPGLSRTDCGGPLTNTDIIPVATDPPTDCTGPQLFYAHNPSTGRTEATSMVNGKDAVAQIFFIQDSNSQLYFGMMNGTETYL